MKASSADHKEFISHVEHTVLLVSLWLYNVARSDSADLLEAIDNIVNTLHPDLEHTRTSKDGSAAVLY
jgi:hypothetical protein